MATKGTRDQLTAMNSTVRHITSAGLVTLIPLDRYKTLMLRSVIGGTADQGAQATLRISLKSTRTTATEVPVAEDMMMGEIMAMTTARAEAPMALRTSRLVVIMEVEGAADDIVTENQARSLLRARGS